VRIRSIELKAYRREFVSPLITAKTMIAHRTGFLIRVTGDNRRAGYGEVGMPPEIEPFLKPSDDTLDPLRDELSKQFLGKMIPQTPGDLQNLISTYFSDAPEHIQFGVEVALADLASRTADKPLCSWLRAKSRPSIPVNYLVDRPVRDWEPLRSAIIQSGYRAVKAKVGVESVDDDVRFVTRLRQELGEGFSIRLDANQAWTFDAAQDALQRMREMQIEYIEEPLEKPDADALKRLHEATGVGIALDESIKCLRDARQALETAVCDALIIKPAAMGGIGPTIEIATYGRKLGRKVVITSSLETEIGIAAHLHLAASIPGEIPPYGLDTLRLYRDADPALTRVVDGAIAVPSGNGLGIGDDLWEKL